jgi:hypothetical protein
MSNLDHKNISYVLKSIFFWEMALDGWFPDSEDRGVYSCSANLTCGLNEVVISVTNCYPKGAGFDSRVMLGIFPLRKRVLRTLVWKEANLSRNPEREGTNCNRLLLQYLLLQI